MIKRVLEIIIGVLICIILFMFGCQLTNIIGIPNSISKDCYFGGLGLGIILLFIYIYTLNHNPKAKKEKYSWDMTFPPEIEPVAIRDFL
jgi:hypothetical protein